MKRSILNSIILIVIAGLLFCGAASLQTDINLIRKDAELTFEEPLQGIPPLLVITTTVLGSFRSIIADILWLRAISLKEQGKYFEHMQLSDWICKLQPRFPSVWAFRAWDMAYNISVEFPTGKERWRWVYNGVKLLRDEGLKYNPQSPQLYKELAWIYYHKIGGRSDDKHWYYKQVFFEQINEIMGEPEFDLELMAQAPLSVKDLLKDDQINSLVQEFKEWDTDLIDSFFKLLKDDITVSQQARALFKEKLGTIPQKPGSFSPMIQVEAFCRAQRLRTEWKLEPKDMMSLREKYGPLDWRFPPTHSLYWIEKGLTYAPEDSTISYDRIAYFSMQEIFQNGKINLIDYNGRKIYLTSPDYRFIDSLDNVFRKNIEFYRKSRGSQGIESAYSNFLDNLIWIAYFSGQMEKAAKYYQKKTPDKPISSQGLRDFIQSRVRDNIGSGSREDILRTIESLLERSWHSYSMGDDTNASFHEKQAGMLYKFYQKENQDRERMVLPPYKVVKQDVLNKILNKEPSLIPFPEILIANLKHRIKTSKNSP